MLCLRHITHTFTTYIPQVNAEFLRVSTIPLEARFMQKLDEKCSELIQIVRKKGGAIRVWRHISAIKHSCDKTCIWAYYIISHE